MGGGVTGLEIGEAVYGLTNDQFIGGYAEFAVASPAKIARKPKVLSFVEAAGTPVVGVTACQMLLGYAKRLGESK